MEAWKVSKSPDLVDLGKRLKEFRKFRGKTQKEVANDLNIRPSVLSSYEVGDREPPIATLKKLSKYYRVTVDCIIGICEMPTFDKAGGLTPEEQSVMDDLVSAWNKFVKLEKQHPNDTEEFADAIHRLQGLLAMRPLRRQYPEYWHKG